MSNTYQPCPFCHSKGVVLKQDGKNFQISCVACGAMGPVGQDQQDAECTWNRRPETNKFKNIAAYFAHIHCANVSDYIAKSVSNNKKYRQINILKKCACLLRGEDGLLHQGMTTLDERVTSAARRCEEGIKCLKRHFK